ncbi:MAG: hypothetical protein OXU63_10760 [Acidobacteriota bacterium]|nr:hypothetical protein [Acidobacteriota bacterium]
MAPGTSPETGGSHEILFGALDRGEFLLDASPRHRQVGQLLIESLGRIRELWSKFVYGG